jgi:hypothetical protein
MGMLKCFNNDEWPIVVSTYKSVFDQITAEILSIGLSEPAPMTAPVLFWMEGNSSTDFGLANHCNNSFILGGF